MSSWLHLGSSSANRSRQLRIERLEDRSMLDGNPTLTLDSPGDVYEGEWFVLSGVFSPPGVYTAVGELIWQGGTPGFTGPIGFTTGEDGSFSITAMPYDDGPAPGNATSFDEETLTLELIVDNEVFVEASTNATVHNVAPTVEDVEFFGSPYENGPYWTLYGVLEDVNSDVLTVTIDWGDDTDPMVFENMSPGAYLWAEHMYLTNSPQTYSVEVTVTDDDTGELVIPLQAEVDPPITLLGDYIWGWEAQDLNYYVHCEADFGEIVEYHFDLDNDGYFDHIAYHQPEIDGVLAFDLALLHLLGDPADDAEYPVKLRIFTDWGYYQDFTVEITIGNMPPEIHFGGDEDGTPGVPFQLMVTTEDPGPDTVTQITVDWGDGASSVINGGFGSVDHVYATDGSYEIRATATDEDGSYWSELKVEIGDTELPPVPSDDPEIISAEAIILANGDALLTIEAVDSSGSTNLDYEWDLDGDGSFELSGPSAVQLAPGTDFYPYMVTVRITDALGRTTEALFAFLQGGTQTRQATINTARDDFIKATPSMPPDWKVHHKIQHFGDVLGKRFLKERGINLHELGNLVAVQKSIHDEITAAQNLFWTQKGKLGITAANIDLDEVIAFANKVETQFGSRWVAARATKGQFTAVANLVQNDAAKFLLAKAARWRDLDLDVLSCFAIFGLILSNAEAVRRINNFDPNTHPQWQTFATTYETAFNESVTSGRVSHNTALHVADSFKAFGESLNLDQGALNKINVAMKA